MKINTPQPQKSVKIRSIREIRVSLSADLPALHFINKHLLKTIFPILILLCATQLHAQSKAIKKIKDNEALVATAYYFYPSTLRMVNLNRDPDFDKLVKPIKRLSFVSLRRDQFDSDKIRTIATELIEKEGCETYAEMSGPDNILFVVGDDSKDYMCVLAYAEEDYYLAEISGKIDFMQLSKLYDKMQSSDSSGVGGFINVFNLMNSSNDNRRQREEERRKWEEKNKAAEEKAPIKNRDSESNLVNIGAKMEKDSLAAIKEMNTSEKPE